MSASRQFGYLQRKSLDTLRAMVPHDCPLIVAINEDARYHAAFTVSNLTQQVLKIGRFQVVAAFIEGYVRAWEVFFR